MERWLMSKHLFPEYLSFHGGKGAFLRAVPQDIARGVEIVGGAHFAVGTVLTDSARGEVAVPQCTQCIEFLAVPDCRQRIGMHIAKNKAVGTVAGIVVPLTVQANVRLADVADLVLGCGHPVIETPIKDAAVLCHNSLQLRRRESVLQVTVVLGALRKDVHVGN